MGVNVRSDQTLAATASIDSRRGFAAGAPIAFKFGVLEWDRQIVRAATELFRSRTVSAQLIESVPVNTIANLTNAGKAGS
jgi:hypothetical protein